MSLQSEGMGWGATVGMVYQCEFEFVFECTKIRMQHVLHIMCYILCVMQTSFASEQEYCSV